MHTKLKYTELYSIYYSPVLKYVGFNSWYHWR